MLVVAGIAHSRFGSRAYVVTRTDAPGAVVVDPGDEQTTAIRARLLQNGGTLDYIVLTHEHIDHVGGVNSLKQDFDCRLVCSRACAQALDKPQSNFSRYLTVADYTISAPDVVFDAPESVLVWGHERMRLLSTPGHSLGSICIAVDSLLFSGDTLIRDTRTVTKLPGGDKLALKESLELIHRSFGPDTTVYPGHGEPFRLGEWKAS